MGLLASSMAIAMLANLHAWQGYFHGDDLDTLSWTKSLPLTEYLRWLALPLYMPSHFRPAGHLIYWVVNRLAGLNFLGYLGVLQSLHLLNILLVWTLLRTLRFEGAAVGLGTLFFSFHAAVIDAYWEPQFLFDVLCASFSLSCMIFFVRRQFLLSFICFWLAYKSKELAVMLPFVLAVYELQLGKRNWKALLPFLAAGFAFGIQGAVMGKQQHAASVYALHYTWNALAKTASFYSSCLFLVPYAGFAVLLAPALVRDRRMWMAVAMVCLFLVPLLPLSDRVLAVYCYLPLCGIAVMAAILSQSPKGALVMACFLAIWLPTNYLYSRPGRERELVDAAANRAYVASARAVEDGAVKDAGGTILLAGWPTKLEAYGALGTFRSVGSAAREIHTYDEPSIGRLMQQNPTVWQWLPASQSLKLGSASQLTFLRMTDDRTIYQLGNGWDRITDGARWMDGSAQAWIYATSDEFLCTTRLRKWTKGSSAATLSLFVDGSLAGVQTFHRTEEQTSRWRLNSNPGRRVLIDLRITPDPGVPSIQVVEMGFAGRKEKR
jgi:hypothetical protein